MSFHRYCTNEAPPPGPTLQSREMGRATGDELERRGASLVGTDVLRVRRLRKTVRSYAEQVEQTNKSTPSKRKRQRMFFVTLTYRDDAPWAAKHVADYIQRVRVWAKRRGHRLPYVWCAEMHVKRFLRTGKQKPHYHLLLWLPPGLTLPKADKRGWWKHGCTQTVVAKSVGYLVKYTSKSDIPEGCKFPPAMRIYGCGGLDEDGKQVHRHAMTPAWIRERVPFGEKWKRAEGGVFRPSTGEWWQCPYSVVVVSQGGKWKLQITKLDEGALKYSNAYGQTWEAEMRTGTLLDIVRKFEESEREIRWALCMEIADEMAVNQ